MVIFQNFKITMDMAGQEDRESLFPIVQVIRDEFFRLMDAIGYGIACSTWSSGWEKKRA